MRVTFRARGSLPRTGTHVGFYRCSRRGTRRVTRTADRSSSGAMAWKLNDHVATQAEAERTFVRIGFNIFMIMITRRSRSPCVTFTCILSFRSAGCFNAARLFFLPSRGLSVTAICLIHRPMSRLIDACNLTNPRRSGIDV